MYKLKEVVGIDIPDIKTRIFRVFDKSKYEKLFSEKSIWFSNIDTLIKEKDPFERTVPQGFYSRMPISDAEHYKRVNSLKDNIYKSYVSCWSRKECKELWDNYDPQHKGFAIVSTCGKVLSAIGSDYFLCCKVLYIDHSDPASGKELGWAIVEDDKMATSASIRIKEQYKDGQYIDDNEIRFIGFDRENKTGQNISVNLTQIIDGAIIDPNADSNVRLQLEEYLTNHGVKIIQSECE